eukprot:scaffold246013_cov44-Prasinocladus_malaysianus.AAC.1
MIAAHMSDAATAISSREAADVNCRLRNNRVRCGVRSLLSRGHGLVGRKIQVGLQSSPLCRSTARFQTHAYPDTIVLSRQAVSIPVETVATTPTVP